MPGMDRVKKYWRPIALGVGLIAAGAGLFVVAAMKKWAAPTTIWAGLGSVATLATAAIAIGTLLALKQDSRDRSRPMMVAQLQPAVLNVQHSELKVTNAGPSVAKNVRVEFDPALPVLDETTHGDRNAFYLQRRYSKVIPTVPPGMVLWNVYRKATEPEEPLPRRSASHSRMKTRTVGPTSTSMTSRLRRSWMKRTSGLRPPVKMLSDVEQSRRWRVLRERSAERSSPCESEWPWAGSVCA